VISTGECGTTVLRCDEFGASFCNNSADIIIMSDKHFMFHKIMYRHYSDEVDNVYIILQSILFRKQCTNVSSESPEICRRYYEKNILVSFFLDNVDTSMIHSTADVSPAAMTESPARLSSIEEQTMGM